MLDVMLIHVSGAILMDIFDFLVCMHILDVLLLLLLATTVIAPLFRDFQRCTTLLKHKYVL